MAGYTGIYVDANAVSPDTSTQVAQLIRAGGGRFVDGGIIGPPPARPGTTRLYLSGPGADEVATVFASSRLEARVLDSGGDHAASALKMTYAAVSKLGSALVIEAHDLARQLGVADALEAEWADSRPELVSQSSQARRSAEAKGWRWVGEMREVSATFQASGRPGSFADAGAEVFERYPRPESPT